MWKQHELLRLLVLGMLLVGPRETDATVIVTVNGAGAYINVLFTKDYFTKFYNCLCSKSKTCTARFFGDVNEIDPGNSDDLGSNDSSIYYHCAYTFPSKIMCKKANSTDVGDNYDTFHVSESQCSYSCVTLIWSYDQEGIDFSNTELDVQQCDDGCVCTETTTPLSTTPVTIATAETSCTNDSDSGLPLYYYVIIGVVAGVVIIIIIIDVVVLLSWKRKYKRNTSNQQKERNIIALPEMNNLEPSPHNRSADRQLSSHYSVVTLSRPSRNLDAHNVDMIRNKDDECVKVTVADSYQKDAGFGYAEPDCSYDTETANNSPQLGIGVASMHGVAEQSKNIYSKLHEENLQLQNPYNTLPQIKEDTHDA